MSPELNILSKMGQTPLHRVKARSLVGKSDARIYIKLYEFNPGASIKARVALNMVLEAEKLGRLIPYTGQTIIVPTGGTTGAGLALVGAQRGYSVRLAVPDNY